MSKPISFRLHEEPLYQKSQISRRFSFSSSYTVPDPQSIMDSFNKQLQHEVSSVSGSPSTTSTLVYEPLLGWDNLNEIAHRSEQYTVYEISNRLSELQRAVYNWDLVMLHRLLDNARFDALVQSMFSESDETSGNRLLESPQQRRVIKRMVIEHVGGLVKPVKNDLEVSEKEINLIMALTL